MPIIILYTRRNVGLYVLTFLKAKGYIVKVITDDENVKWLADELKCELIDLDSMSEFDLFLCVHGNKIIDEKYLVGSPFVNVHPCLNKYKGHNPIKKYIANKDTQASIESHYMVKEVDAGEVIHQEFFETPVCNTYADFYNLCVDKYLKCVWETLKIVLY